jgi:hypothetical protein
MCMSACLYGQCALAHGFIVNKHSHISVLLSIQLNLIYFCMSAGLDECQLTDQLRIPYDSHADACCQSKSTQYRCYKHMIR